METFEELENRLRNIGYHAVAPLLVETMKPVFDLGLKVFCWEQYTPGFNDGDVCEFSLHDPAIPAPDGERSFWADNLDYELKDHAEYLNSIGITVENEKTISDALYESFRPLHDVESVLRFIFGESVRVTVYADGRIEVDEYEWEM